jgi:hypothetical protein
MQLAEVGDAEVGFGLDAVLGGSREPAQDELAIEEQRVGRAVNEVVAARLQFRQYPRRADRPAQQIRRARFVDELDPGEPDRLPPAGCFDDDGAAAGDFDDADHGRACLKGNE